MPAPLPESSSAQRAISEVKQIYTELAKRPLERNCQLVTGCCRFQLTGKIPHLTKGEALVTAQAVRATGRKSLPERPDGACPLLDPRTSRCLIYQSRPFGCRTHFCEAAGGALHRSEVVDLIHRLDTIDASLGGEGARELSKSISDALRQI